MYFIIISIAVVLILWSFTNKGDYLFAQKQPAQKQPTPRPSTQKPGSRINYKIKNTAPTTSEIAKGLAALKAHNTSGHVPTSSAYYDLVKRKYLQYDKKQKKWVSYLDPAGKAAPPAIDDGKGSQQGHKTKPVSGGSHTSGGNTGGNTGGSHTSGGSGGGSHPSVPHFAPLPPRGSKAPIKPRQSSYCNQGSFYGNTNCSQASSRVTETNVFNGEHPDKFPDTTSPIKAAYLAIGTANEQNIPSSTRYHGPTTAGSNYGLGNSGQAAFNYDDSSAVPAIIKALKSRVDVIAKTGANAIRFDELDVCSWGQTKCNQANVNKVLTAVSQYAYQAHKMSILGNNDSDSDNHKAPTSAQAIVQSGVPIAGWIVENDASTGKQLRNILGNNVPIYGVADARDEANKMSKAQTDGTAVFDSVAVYPK